MAEYRPPLFGADVNVFNPRFFNFSELGALTEAYLDTRYITFPKTQYEQITFQAGAYLANSSALTFTDGTSINTAPLQEAVVSNVFSDPSPIVANVGQNTRNDLAKISWSWGTNDLNFANVIISIKYNLTSVFWDGGGYSTGVRFNDEGHIEVQPFLLGSGAIDITLDGITTPAAYSTGSFGLAYTGRSYYDWGQTFISNIFGNIYAEWIVGNNYITLYAYNKNNSILIAFGTPYQQPQGYMLNAAIENTGLRTGQTGVVSIEPLDNQIKPYP